MTSYYNEFDPFAAQWLRNLIDAGHIAPGVVDERSITDVTPGDLKGFTQCHFFAGIGGWSHALRLAAVPDDYPCWTGSPPCQPFSTAGKQLGQLDDRHLAPVFLRLIAQCRPAALFGEQVAAAIGKHWLDDLFTELETEGYACGAAVLPACGIGAPHERKRLFFGAHLLANPNSKQCYGEWVHGSAEGDDPDSSRASTEPAGHCDTGSVAHYDSQRSQGQRVDRHPQGWQKQAFRQAGLCDRTGVTGSMEYPGCQRRERGQATTSRHEHDGKAPQRTQGQHGAGKPGTYRLHGIAADTHHSFWSDADWLSCKDGKFRSVEPGTFPLVDGIPKGMGRGKSSPAVLAGRNRKGRLRGYGNAIVPQVAAEFVTAFMAALSD